MFSRSICPCTFCPVPAKYATRITFDDDAIMACSHSPKLFAVSVNNVSQTAHIFHLRYFVRGRLARLEFAILGAEDLTDCFVCRDKCK